jgi:hypothetical protein
MKEFLRRHRAELDACISRALNMERNPRPNDRERELWVRNYSGLYNWARREGVKV